MAKGRKTGGRVKGTPNKATAEVRAYAQQYSTECIDGLMAIARNKKCVDVARVMAFREILDRAHGKPAQEIVGQDGAALIPSVIRFVVTKAPGADTRT